MRQRLQSSTEALTTNGVGSVQFAGAEAVIGGGEKRPRRAFRVKFPYVAGSQALLCPFSQPLARVLLVTFLHIPRHVATPGNNDLR